MKNGEHRPKPGRTSIYALLNPRFGFGENLPHMPKMKDIHVPDIPEGTRTGAFSGPRFDDEGNELSWSYTDLVINWCENTSIHGIKFVTEKSDLKARKLIWLVVVLTFSSLLTLQVITRLEHYYTYKKNINVDKIVITNMTFPTITFCNQNKYKLSKTAYMGYYNSLIKIEQLNISDSNELKNLTDDTNPVLKTSMETLVDMTSFELRDMLIECKWKGFNCGIEDFTRRTTDQGICYSFNLPNDTRDLRNVSDSGIDNGLSILFNVQQYDYMPVKFGISGIRFLPHNYYEYPAVSEIGLAASTGTHTFVRLRAIQSSKLKDYEPFCESKKMEYFQNQDGSSKEYDQSSCLVACRTRWYFQNCSCVQQHQKSIAEMIFRTDTEKLKRVRVCSLKEEYTCIAAKARPYFQHTERKNCHCFVPCNSVTYEQSLSYSSMATPEILFANVLPRVTIDHKEVRNVLSTIDPSIREKDVDLIKKFSNSVDDLSVLYLQNLTQFLNQTKLSLEQNVEAVQKALRQKLQYFKEQMKEVNKLFTQRYILADKVTFSMVGHNMWAFIIEITDYMDALRNSSINDESTRNHTFFLAKMSIEIQTQCVNSAIKKLNSLDHCYANGLPCDPRVRPNRYLRAVIPRLTLREFENHKENNETWVTLNNYLSDMSIGLNGISQCLQETFQNKSNYQNNKFRVYKQTFEDFAKRWITNYTPVLKKKFEGPYLKMITRRKRIEKGLASVDRKKHKFFNQISDTLSNLTTVSETHLPTLLYFQQTSMTFVNCDLLNKRNCPFRKDELAKELKEDEEKLNNAINQLNAISDQLKRYKTEWNDIMSELRLHEVRTWNFVLGDMEAQDLYKYHKLNWTYVNVAKHVMEVLTFYEEIQNSLTFLIAMSPVGHTVSRYLQNLNDRMAKYNQKNILTSQFFINNLLKINFYFEDLTIESISEEPAYLLTALMSDVGGTLGLFIGMSLLSVVEVLDLFFQIFYHRPKKSTKEEPLDAVVSENPDAKMEPLSKTPLNETFARKENSQDTNEQLDRISEIAEEDEMNETEFQNKRVSDNNAKQSEP